MTSDRFPYDFKPTPSPMAVWGFRRFGRCMGGFLVLLPLGVWLYGCTPHSPAHPWHWAVVLVGSLMLVCLSGATGITLYGTAWNLFLAARRGEDATGQWAQALRIARCSQEELVRAYEQLGDDTDIGQAVLRVLNEEHPQWYGRRTTAPGEGELKKTVGPA